MRNTMSRQQEKVVCKLLKILVLVVLIAGIAVQITLQIRVHAQEAQIASVQKQIQSLNADIMNLNLCIDQNYDLEAIAARAKALGMEEIDETRVRVVTLYGGHSESTTQTALANGD